MDKNEDKGFKLSVKSGFLMLMLHFLKQTYFCLIINSYLFKLLQQGAGKYDPNW